MNLLLVVVAIGKDYRLQYGNVFEPSHRRYCERHGFGLHIVDQPIDPDGGRFPVVLQRLLMCSLPEAGSYSHVAHVDADILINNASPSLLEAVGETEAVGMVDEFDQPTPELRQRIQKRRGWETQASDYYRLAGFPVSTRSVFNTGLFVAQPAKHRDLFEKLYERGKREMNGNPRGAHYEGALIGSALIERSWVKTIDNRWNALFPIYLQGLKAPDGIDLPARCRQLALNSLLYRKVLFRRYYSVNYFVHMAGGIYRGLESEISRVTTGAMGSLRSRPD